MKSCEHVQSFLGAWLDGELNPSDSTFITEHIEQCSGCLRERDQLVKLQSSLAGVLLHNATPVTHEQFWRQLESRLAQNSPWWARLSEGFGRFFAGPRLAWSVPAAVGTLLLVISGFHLLKFGAAPAARNNYAVVDSIDAFGRSVALWREDETKTTVIWLYQQDEGEKEVVEQPTQASPTF